eukprot:1159627-Pelagomonas_calceolata.AAC.2
MTDQRPACVKEWKACKGQRGSTPMSIAEGVCSVFVAHKEPEHFEVPARRASKGMFSVHMQYMHTCNTCTKDLMHFTSMLGREQPTPYRALFQCTSAFDSRLF